MEKNIEQLLYPPEKKESPFSNLKAGHVGIRTNKIDELLNWYEKNLDFRVIKKWSAGDIRLAFMAPPANNDFIIEVICYDATTTHTGLAT